MADIGDVVPSHFNASIVTASYFASLCGCLLTVELLHRRGTGTTSLRAWAENLGSGIALGVIGIWCMHFIGNRAIILGDGTAAIQLVYSPGYSTLSVFLPIIGLTLAFAAAEANVKSPVLHWIALTCTGVFAGLSVVGMHYIGNFGISNYRLQYVTAYLAASVVIAIGDCLAVLLLFYNWRNKWISDWWKRLLCAVALAGGVSAMHFTASTNCIYQLKHYNDPDAIRSRDVQVIIAGILCGTAGIIVLCVLFFTRHRTRVRREGSQKVMLACAMFDPDGRVLVTTEGVLPSKQLTGKFNNRTFDEDFDTTHPVFQWIFRVSHNWLGVSDLIPKMKSHLGLRGEDAEAGSRPSSSGSSAQYDTASNSDYSVYFRERFCTVAAGLAASMHIAVEDIGVLYDNIIDTGTIQPEDRVAKRNTMQTSLTDPEGQRARAEDIFGKGQLLFLTRQLGAVQADKLLNAGFRFASVQQVGRNIAESMQIPLAALDMHMENLQQYAEHVTTVEKAGTWLSVFAIVPKANSKGFEVVVKRQEQDQLPDFQLLAFEPQPWQARLLGRMNGFNTQEMLAHLQNPGQGSNIRPEYEQHFAMAVLQGLQSLRKQIPSSWFQSARFVGRPVYAHYSQSTNVTFIYALVICVDPHGSREVRGDLEKIPLSFFNTRQQCHAGSPNHQVLARNIHREFGPLLTPKGLPQLAPPRRFLHRSRPTARRPSVAHSTGENSDTDRSSDTHELVEKPRHLHLASLNTTAGAERENAWGGILVNSETVIQSDSKMSNTNVSTHDLGIRVAVSTSKPEATYVDELFAIAREMLTTKTG